MHFARAFEEAGKTVHYFEFTGRYVSREIVVHPDITLLLRAPECSEEPLESYDFTPAETLSADEFLRLWVYHEPRPHSTRGDDHPLVQRALGRLNSPNSPGDTQP